MARTMNEIVNTFYAVVDDRFQFLIDQFGCGKEKKEPGGGIYNVLYLNATTGVEIGLEWREQYIYVELIRLIDGRVRENPIIITPDSELTVFNLEDLLTIRAPKHKLSNRYVRQPLSVQQVEYIVTDYAFVLREYAADVLRGDFGVFTEMETLVKSRISGESEVENNIREYYRKIIESDEIQSRLQELIRDYVAALVREMQKQEISFDEIQSRLQAIVRDNFEDAIEEFKKLFIINTLKETNGNVTMAAKRLNISRNMLHHYTSDQPAKRRT